MAEPAHKDNSRQSKRRAPCDAAAARRREVLVVLVCGLPGSGKSTFSKQLREKGWARISQDDEGSAAGCVKLLEKHVRGYTGVVIDRCNVGVSDRKQWASYASAAAERMKDKPNVVLECVFMDTPPAVCIERIENRSDHPTLPPEDSHLVTTFYSRLQPPTKYELPYAEVFTVRSQSDAGVLLKRYDSPLRISRNHRIAASSASSRGASDEEAADPQLSPASTDGGKAAGGKPGPSKATDPLPDLYLVRHGERADRVGHSVELPDDCSITAQGRLEARMAGEYINQHAGLAEDPPAGPRTVTVYASPFLRCVQTAAEIAGQLGCCSVRIEPGLCEVLIQRLFPSDPTLSGPSRCARDAVLAEAGVALDTTVPPVCKELPKWPEKAGDAARRVAGTLARLRGRHQTNQERPAACGEAPRRGRGKPATSSSSGAAAAQLAPAEQVVVAVMHAHGVSQGSIMLPGKLASPVLRSPGYCALTHIDPFGVATRVTDTSYRSVVSGSLVGMLHADPAALRARHARLQQTAAGAFDKSWRWSQRAQPPGDVASDVASRPDHCVRSLPAGELEDTDDTTGAPVGMGGEDGSLVGDEAVVRSLRLADFDLVLSWSPRFQKMYRHGSAEQAKLFRERWDAGRRLYARGAAGEEGTFREEAKLVDKVRAGAREGWFAPFLDARAHCTSPAPADLVIERADFGTSASRQSHRETVVKRLLSAVGDNQPAGLPDVFIVTGLPEDQLPCEQLTAEALMGYLSFADVFESFFWQNREAVLVFVRSSAAPDFQTTVVGQHEGGSPGQAAELHCGPTVASPAPRAEETVRRSRGGEESAAPVASSSRPELRKRAADSIPASTDTAARRDHQDALHLESPSLPTAEANSGSLKPRQPTARGSSSSDTPACHSDELASQAGQPASATEKTRSEQVRQPDACHPSALFVTVHLDRAAVVLCLCSTSTSSRDDRPSHATNGFVKSGYPDALWVHLSPAPPTVEQAAKQYLTPSTSGPVIAGRFRFAIARDAASEQQQQQAGPARKFPRTQHAFLPEALAGRSPGASGACSASRDDLVMPLSQGAALIRSPTVTAEEKVDGSNLAVYLDASGAVTCQNRGKFVTPSSGSQWGGQLATWLESHYCELVSLLRQRYILYGEWLLARHSIRYQSLPDYFVAFDVYDRTARRFLSAKKRNAFLSQSTIPVVKPLAVGPFAEADILRLLGSPSRYGAAKVEGIYLRSDSGAWLQQRAKVVNSDFLQTIDDDGHWQKRVLEKNQLKY